MKNYVGFANDHSGSMVHLAKDTMADDHRRERLHPAQETPSAPKPPPSRIIREGSGHFCPKCGSTMLRRYWLIGQLKCIQKECRYEQKNLVHSSISAPREEAIS